jgi:Zn-dependent oligopeptidase
MAKSGIHIKESHKGRFTAKAKARGMSVSAFANQVMANPSRYAPATVKQASFAKSARKWKH